MTDPRLDPIDPEHAAAARAEAVAAANRTLRDSTARANADHRRLAVLGALALAVGILLLALIATRSSKSPATSPSSSPAERSSSAGEVVIDVTDGTAAPSPIASPPSAPTTPPSAAPSTVGAPSGEQHPVGPPNPKSSAVRPGPSQDVPGDSSPAPQKTSDRPF